MPMPMPPDARTNGRWASESGNGNWTDATRPNPRNSSMSGTHGSTGRKPVGSCEEVSKQRKAQREVKDLDQAELLGRLAAWEGGNQPSPSDAGTPTPTPTPRKLPPSPLTQLRTASDNAAAGQPQPQPLSPISPLLHRRSCHSWNGGINPNPGPNSPEPFPPRGATSLLSPTPPTDPPTPHRGLTLLSPKPSLDRPGPPPDGLVKAQCDRASAQTSYLLQLLDSTPSPTKQARQAADAATPPPSPMRLPRNGSLTRGGPPPASPSAQSRAAAAVAAAATKPEVSADIAGFLRFHPGERKGFGGQLAADAKQALARRNALSIDTEPENPQDWLPASASATPTHRALDPRPFSPRPTSSQDSMRTRESVLAPAASPSDSPRPDLLPRLLSRSRQPIHEAAELTSEATRTLQAVLYPHEPRGENPGVDPSCKWRFNPNAGDMSPGSTSSYMYVYKRSASRSIGGGG